MSRMLRSRKSAGSMRPVAELFEWTPLRLRCRSCQKPATIIDSGTALCGPCFLEESLRRCGDHGEAASNLA